MDIYKDRFVTAALPQKPATKGHVRLLVQQQRFEDLSSGEFAHLLSTALFTSTALFENVGAHGTNILITDLDGLQTDVLARTEGDGLNLRWDPRQVPPEEMEVIAAKVKDQCDYIGQPQKPASSKPSTLAPVKREPVIDEGDDGRKVSNYLIKQLDRLP